MHRTIVAGILAAALTIGVAGPARALTPDQEAGYSLLAAGANIFYVPAKTIISLLALPVGAFSGWISGGSERDAYAFWVPTSGGTWFLTTANLAGEEPVQFFGDDYADMPSTVAAQSDGSYIYSSAYDMAK